MKANTYYLNIIENRGAALFISKNDRREVLNAANTLKRRTIKGVEYQQITEEECAYVLNWLNKVIETVKGAEITRRLR